MQQSGRLGGEAVAIADERWWRRMPVAGRFYWERALDEDIYRATSHDGPWPRLRCLRRSWRAEGWDLKMVHEWQKHVSMGQLQTHCRLSSPDSCGPKEKWRRGCGQGWPMTAKDDCVRTTTVYLPRYAVVCHKRWSTCIKQHLLAYNRISTRHGTYTCACCCACRLRKWSR